MGAVMKETALLFPSGDHLLTGILHHSSGEPTIGVLVVVGGPQYRVGSHRQFVLLARELAGGGWPTLRFDYQGMGDSTGNHIDFEASGADIRSAIDLMFAQIPSLSRIVIWGLCDAASAACLYAHQDARVSGLILLNPWVRTPEGEAKTLLRHYYLKRLTNPDFWKKLFRGGVSLGGAVSGISDQVKSASSQGAAQASGDLPSRMGAGFERFKGQSLFILSGNDLVADEFRDRIKSDPLWNRLMEREHLQLKQLDEANHTFARIDWRNQVSRWSKEWLSELSG